MGCPWGPTTNYVRPTFKGHPNKISYNPRQHYPYLPCGLHVDFSSARNVMSCAPKVPSCKSKNEAPDFLNQ